MHKARTPCTANRFMSVNVAGRPCLLCSEQWKTGSGKESTLPCTLVQHACFSGPVKSVIMPMPCAFCLRYAMLTLRLKSLQCLCAIACLQAKTVMSD